VLFCDAKFNPDTNPNAHIPTSPKSDKAGNNKRTSTTELFVSSVGLLKDVKFYVNCFGVLTIITILNVNLYIVKNTWISK
jgi:hypothetical protein